MRRRRQRWRAVVAVWACLAAAAVAQAGEKAVAVVPADPSQLKELEEIVIQGNAQSLTAAYQAMVDAEDRFYERFNATNTDHRYDINCRTEAPTMSIIRVRTCLPRVVEEQAREEAWRLGQISEGNIMLQSLDDLRRAWRPRLREMALERVRKDPKLLQALLEHARLTQHYEELRKQKFAGGKLVVVD